MRKVVVSTGNRGKFEEIKEIVREVLNAESIMATDLFHDYRGVNEGDDYFTNALLKASVLAVHSDIPVLAEDSGLEIPCLGDAPGPHSSRLGGSSATDEDKIRLILEKMKSAEDRQARYICTAVLMDHRGRYVRGYGTVEGVIAKEKKGEKGFGYDPIFYYPLAGKTFAEMEAPEKNAVSHRRKAIEALAEKIKKVNFWNM